MLVILGFGNRLTTQPDSVVRVICFLLPPSPCNILIILVTIKDIVHMRVGTVENDKETNGVLLTAPHPHIGPFGFSLQCEGNQPGSFVL